MTAAPVTCLGCGEGDVPCACDRAQPQMPPTPVANKRGRMHVCNTCGEWTFADVCGPCRLPTPAPFTPTHVVRARRCGHLLGDVCGCDEWVVSPQSVNVPDLAVGRATYSGRWRR